MKAEDINEMKRIVDKYIPLGTPQSLCHVGISNGDICPRCNEARTIRFLIEYLEIHGHIGK